MVGVAAMVCGSVMTDGARRVRLPWSVVFSRPFPQLAAPPRMLGSWLIGPVFVICLHLRQLRHGMVANLVLCSLFYVMNSLPLQTLPLLSFRFCRVYPVRCAMRRNDHDQSLLISFPRA